MSPFSIGIDTLVTTAVSLATSIVVGVMVWVVQRRMAKAEAMRETRKAEAERERDEQRDMFRSEHDCVAAMARVSLVTMADGFERKGYFPFEARQSFDALYDSYRSMGEDGLICETVERARALPMHDKQGG